jgi:diguanylate cyclase (GGDEF)-like protein
MHEARLIQGAISGTGAAWYGAAGRLRLVFTSARSHLVLVGILLLATIGTADMVLIRMQREAAIESYGRSISNLAEGYAKSMAQFFAMTESTLTQCGGDLAVHATSPPEGMPLAQWQRNVGTMLADCGRSLQSSPSAAIYDAQGRLFASSRPWPLAVRTVAQADFFQAIKLHGPGANAVSRPLAGSGGGIAMYIASWLSDRNGRFAGVTVIELNLNVLEKYYKAALPTHRSLMYARDDGVILMHSPHVDGLSGTNVPQGSAWYASASLGGGGIWYRVEGRGTAEPYFAVSRKVPGRPLVVEVSALESEVLADAQRRRPWMIGIGLAASASILLLLRTVASHLTRVENAKRTLESTQEQLQATLSNVSQGVCFFGSDQRLVVSNRKYAEMYGLNPDSIRPGMPLSEIMYLCRAAGTAPASMPEGGTAEALAGLLAAGDCHIDVDLMDGRVIAMQQRFMPDGGWVATHEDITSRRQAEKNIAYLAHHDPLTGLANRSHFQHVAARALTELRRGAKFSILFLDLDRFKSINDTMGHKAGDDVLETVAERLQGIVRKTDTIARFGGDEFAILQCRALSEEATLRLAERIIHALSAPYALDCGTASVGVSIGIAMAPEDGVTADALLKNADMALYLAKSEGRGTFRFFEPEMDARLTRRHEIERDLRAAIANDQFELYYQPVVDIGTGAVTAFEALVRWTHPQKGFLPPGEFIDIAEDCGLIIPLGKWVLHQACLQATQWPETIRVAVNLSPIQFRAPGLVEMVADQLAQSGLAPGRLELEITESVILASSDDNVATLHRLRDLGVTIAMDDFGVGYSSLSYLHCFPFDRIKIDRSFVTNMITRREALFIVRAVIGLCRDLDVQTTVEGVETEEQLAILRREKATHVQGYYFSRPMPAQNVAGFLAKRPTHPLVADHRTLAMVADGAAGD